MTGPTTNTTKFHCLLCGSQNGGIYLRKNGIPPARLDLARCKDCSFLQQQPIPELAQASAMYEEGAEYGEHQLRAEELILQRDAGMLAELAEQGASGPLLDVGAGGGIILRAAQERDWQATGIEISKPDAKRIRASLGCEVLEEPLSTVALPEKHFGVVTLSHSLEHLVDPVPSLQRAAALLRKDGLIHIAVPNWQSLKRTVAGKHVSWIYAHHITYFTKATLDRALRQAGFEALQWKISNYPGQDLLFIIALLRRMNLECFLRRWLRLGEQPLEVLLTEGLQLQCPTWRFRMVLRFARWTLALWPDRLSCFLGRADELRVTAQLKR